MGQRKGGDPNPLPGVAPPGRVGATTQSLDRQKRAEWVGRGSETYAELQPSPEDTLVETAWVAELIVVGHLRAKGEGLQEVDV